MSPQSANGKGTNALGVEVSLTEESNALAGFRPWAVQFAWRHCSTGMACLNSKLLQKQLEFVLFQDVVRTVRAPPGGDHSRVDVRGAAASLFGRGKTGVDVWI